MCFRSIMHLLQYEDTSISDSCYAQIITTALKNIGTYCSHDPHSSAAYISLEIHNAKYHNPRFFHA